MVAGIADRADPAPHRGQRPLKRAAIRRYPLPRALANSADPMTAVVSARRKVSAGGSNTWVTRQVRHRARRGRRTSVM